MDPIIANIHAIFSRATLDKDNSDWRTSIYKKEYITPLALVSQLSLLLR